MSANAVATRAVAQRSLAQAQLSQQLGGRRLQGALGERASEPTRRLVGRRLGDRALARGHQRCGHAGGAARREGGQMRRHSLDRGARLGQQVARGLVRGVALSHRHRVVDRAQHERMDEGERVLGAQHLDAPKLMGDPSRLPALEVGQSGGGLQPRAIAQDGHRACQRGRLRSDPRDPAHDAVAERGYGDVVEGEPRRAVAVERHGAQELLEVERVSGRHLMGGPACCVVGLGEAAAYDLRH